MDTVQQIMIVVLFAALGICNLVLFLMIRENRRRDFRLLELDDKLADIVIDLEKRVVMLEVNSKETSED